HVAAKVSTLSASAGEQRSLYDINVLGTRNLLRAARQAEVARVVVTGSFSATGYDPDDPSRPASDERPFYPFGAVMPYAHTKALAEHETLKAVVRGLDAVIATSTACVGPYDYIPSRMGRTMCDYAKGKLRAYVPGGFEFVRAADLAAGHIAAMERGQCGHKYIFATHFHTLEDLVNMWAEVMGTPPVRLKVPAALMSGVTGLYSGALSKFFPNMPQRLNPGAISVLRMRRHADTTKAQTELGWKPTDLRSAVIEAYDFFARASMIERQPVVAVPREAPSAAPRASAG
ncbi:MAG: NAD-dependent epimerase/dehydratase family protein, partial [Myxococcota bacterium]